MESKQTREFRNWTINVIVDGDPLTRYRIRNQTIRNHRNREWEIVKVNRPDVDFPDDLEAFEAAFASCRIKIESKGEVYG
jgi:RNA:NAD 2'-phosphotransferase (TPT1/KptA family)